MFFTAYVQGKNLTEKYKTEKKILANPELPKSGF